MLHLPAKRATTMTLAGDDCRMKARMAEEALKNALSAYYTELGLG